ncbi:MAG: hypothetical protein Q9227_004720 [Pyrenula ochraceoflavens]
MGAWIHMRRLPVFGKVILALCLSLPFASAVDLVLARDPAAMQLVNDQEGYNIYLGYAEWKEDPGLDDYGRMAALAKDAYNTMVIEANADGLDNIPNAVTALYIGDEAFFASSVTKRNPDDSLVQRVPFDPARLLSAIRRPLIGPPNDPGDQPPVNYANSFILDILAQTIAANAGSTDHDSFCAEPFAIAQFLNARSADDSLGGSWNDFFKGKLARIATWTSDGKVVSPCQGQRSGTQSIGCERLVTFIGLDYVPTDTAPVSIYEKPAYARADNLCMGDATAPGTRKRLK